MPLDNIQDRNFYRDAMRTMLLDAETEHKLALAWRDDRDEQALHRLIKAYLRLAISYAAKYRRYGATQADLVQEASIGLMKAAEKFDPDRGVRFSTYAQWWIKASVQDYVMRNYSMVRTGSTTNQKSLFFNLHRIAAKLEREAEQNGITLTPDEHADAIATELGVSTRDVKMMQGRLSGGDASLNATQANDEEGREWIETLIDDRAQAAEQVAHTHDQDVLKGWIGKVFEALSERERYIITQRKMIDQPRTLESIGNELKLSKERIRQIETAALDKLRKLLDSKKPQLQEFLH